jgi:ppGpp synthetase/RelA/SpoT-type nucleotidyltranferase
VAISDEVIEAAVARDARERDRYIKLAARVADICLAEVIEGDAIRAQVTYRTKSVQSFRGKLGRFARNPNKNYPTVDAVFDGIGDFAGVRVATYRPEDENKVTQRLRELFVGGDGGDIDVDPKNKLDPDKGQFYRATHCQVFLKPEDLVGNYENLRSAGCEVQVCSMMAHVWNEIEHDIGYKPAGGGPAGAELGLLEALGHLTRSGDAMITRLLEANELRMEDQQGEFTDVHDFVARARPFFPTADLSVNAGQAYDALLRLKLHSPGLMQEALGPHLHEAYAVAQVEAFNAFAKERARPDAVLNASSADLVTILLLPMLARMTTDTDASARPRGGRLASAVNLWRDMVAALAENPEAEPEIVAP